MNGQWPDHIWHGSQTDRLQPKPEQPNEHPWLPAERLRLGQCPTAFQFLTNFLPTQSYPEKAKYYAPYSDHGGYPASTQLLLRLACLQLLLAASNLNTPGASPPPRFLLWSLPTLMPAFDPLPSASDGGCLSCSK